jgi:hypothetical protein
MKTYRVVGDCVVDPETQEVIYDDVAGRVGEIIAFLLTDNALLKADRESAIVKAKREAYEDAAQIAERKAREADEWAKREGMPPDYGGDDSIALEIRALKDSLLKS